MRRPYTKPLIVSIGLCVFGEFWYFTTFGMILFPGGTVLHKFLWAIVFFGLGMGATIGAMIDLCVVDRFSRHKALFLTALIFSLVITVCTFLCWRLDHTFNYFGGSESPALLLIGGVMGGVVGGLICGWLLNTEGGDRLLQKAGI